MNIIFNHRPGILLGVLGGVAASAVI